MDQSVPRCVAATVGIRLHQIGNVQDAFSGQKSGGNSVLIIGADGSRLRSERDMRGRDTAHRDRRYILALKQGEFTHRGVAQPHRTPDHGVENRLKFAGEALITPSTSAVAV